jgi:hypothetical protein
MANQTTRHSRANEPAALNFKRTREHVILQTQNQVTSKLALSQES